MYINCSQFSFIILLVLTSSCSGQSADSRASTRDTISGSRRIGGAFENSEYLYIGMPDSISSVDTSDGWSQSKNKLLITGKIYQRDGKTPAPDVILYYYHADASGLYSSNADLDERIMRHGYLRGWVKSDSSGSYSIFTLKPAAYPNSDIPAHIHPAIKEPDKNEYYLDEFVFDDDKLLTSSRRRVLENRGGSGVLRTFHVDGIEVAEHDIILGLNIPDYPLSVDTSNLSGLYIGEEVISFTPFHAWGPDRGSRACPICKYGKFQGVIYFVGNNPHWEDIRKWLSFFEMESRRRGKHLKVYFVYGNENGFNAKKRETELAQIGKELGLQQLALTFVPSMSDRLSDVYLNRIEPSVRNTIIIYRQSRIVDKFVDLPAIEENYSLVSLSLDRTASRFSDRRP